MGMKNHHLVQFDLIQKISKLSPSATTKSLKTVHKYKLVVHEAKKCDGYRLTFLGYDFLAINALTKRKSVEKIGSQIGVGKESDVFKVTNERNEIMVLKLHRLGRISFRTIKDNRDYLGKRSNANWLYCSRLAATKEYEYLKVLHEKDFPVPRPIDCSRHCVLMDYFEGIPLNNLKTIYDADIYYKALNGVLFRMRDFGYIHCDFNEFNVLVSPKMIEKGLKEEKRIELLKEMGEKSYNNNLFEELGLLVIDFPQMVSSSHENADDLFGRDETCIKTFFMKRFGLEIN
ncbi:hypothetical protein MHBO_001557 [Bonamia ostreae]